MRFDQIISSLKWIVFLIVLYNHSGAQVFGHKLNVYCLDLFKPRLFRAYLSTEITKES